jgi:hypothetical protein
MLLLTGGRPRFAFALYSIADDRWTVVRRMDGIELPALVGHRAFITGEGVGIIVGGAVEGQDGAMRSNEKVIRFRKWGERITVLACSGMTPANRPWASCGKVGQHVVVVGGEQEAEPFLLDANTMMWGRPEPPPSQFFGAAAVSTIKEMYIHGGINEDGVLAVVLYRVTIQEDGKVPNVQLDDDEQDQWATNVLKYPQSVKDEAWVQG